MLRSAAAGAGNYDDDDDCTKLRLYAAQLAEQNVCTAGHNLKHKRTRKSVTVRILIVICVRRSY